MSILSLLQRIKNYDSGRKDEAILSDLEQQFANAVKPRDREIYDQYMELALKRHQAVNAIYCDKNSMSTEEFEIRLAKAVGELSRIPRSNEREILTKSGEIIKIERVLEERQSFKQLRAQAIEECNQAMSDLVHKFYKVGKK